MANSLQDLPDRCNCVREVGRRRYLPFVGAGTQVARSSEAGATHKSAWLWIATAACLVLLPGLWVVRSSRNLIVRTVHPYRVSEINSSDATMHLVHGNHTYVVRCAGHCGEFRTGGFYRMDDAGAVLQYKHAGQAISLPIIEEQTTFDVTGGHG
jgi:hypothetical protein